MWQIRSTGNVGEMWTGLAWSFGRRGGRCLVERRGRDGWITVCLSCIPQAISAALRHAWGPLMLKHDSIANPLSFWKCSWCVGFCFVFYLRLGLSGLRAPAEVLSNWYASLLGRQSSNRGGEGLILLCEVKVVPGGPSLLIPSWPPITVLWRSSISRWGIFFCGGSTYSQSVMARMGGWCQEQWPLII